MNYLNVKMHPEIGHVNKLSKKQSYLCLVIQGKHVKELLKLVPIWFIAGFYPFALATVGKGSLTRESNFKLSLQVY